MLSCDDLVTMVTDLPSYMFWTGSGVLYKGFDDSLIKVKIVLLVAMVVWDSRARPMPLTKC